LLEEAGEGFGGGDGRSSEAERSGGFRLAIKKEGPRLLFRNLSLVRIKDARRVRRIPSFSVSPEGFSLPQVHPLGKSKAVGSKELRSSLQSRRDLRFGAFLEADWGVEERRGTPFEAHRNRPDLEDERFARLLEHASEEPLPAGD